MSSVVSTHRTPRATRLRACRLLLVDDEPSNLDLLEALLESEGYEQLIRTTDSREVLSLTQQYDPDLILLDLHMPHKHGLDVLRELTDTKSTSAYRPVLVLTADATVDARDRALALGARDFVTKPFDATEVLLRVENLLDTRVLHLEEHEARLRAEHAERQALELLAQAQLATTERERLLAVVAHDLRNPLGAISMYAEVLANLQPDDDLPLGDSEQRTRTYARRALETIRESTQSMQRLVQDLLDASTLKGNALQIVRQPVSSRAVAEAAVQMLSLRAEAADVRIVVDACDEEVSVDGQRVTQLIGNLVSNALAVTPRGGTVELKLAMAAGSPVLRGSVADTGPGIPLELMPHLFTAFWRGDRRDREGVGLGLWIARAIAEAHGGDLTAVSLPGQGAVFSFTLPLVDRETRPED